MVVLQDRNYDSRNKTSLAMKLTATPDPAITEVEMQAAFAETLRDWQVFFRCSSKELHQVLEELQHVSPGSVQWVDRPSLGLSFLVEVPEEVEDDVDLCIILDSGWVRNGIQSNSGPGIRLTTTLGELRKFAAQLIRELLNSAEEERSEGMWPSC